MLILAISCTCLFLCCCSFVIRLNICEGRFQHKGHCNLPKDKGSRPPSLLFSQSIGVIPHRLFEIQDLGCSESRRREVQFVTAAALPKDALISGIKRPILTKISRVVIFSEKKQPCGHAPQHRTGWGWGRGIGGGHRGGIYIYMYIYIL
jgi:hypothetical protein